MSYFCRLTGKFASPRFPPQKACGIFFGGGGFVVCDVSMFCSAR